MPGSDMKVAREALRLFAETLVANCDVLTEIDSKSGDGDLGISMFKGGNAILETLKNGADMPVGVLFTSAGSAFNRAAPSTMGTLLSMSLMSLGREWKEKTSLEVEDAIKASEIIANTIARFGKAQKGNKTILDALYPFSETLRKEYDCTEDLKAAYSKAVSAAKVGMEATKGMKATMGRARWLGDGAVESVDGGAFICALVVEKLEDLFI